MIKVQPYTQVEREEIAQNIRIFARQQTYEHVTVGGSRKRIAVHDVPMTRCKRQYLALLAATIEHNVHDKGPPTEPITGAP